MSKAVRIIVINPDTIARIGIRTILCEQADLALVGELTDCREIARLNGQPVPTVLLLAAGVSAVALAKSLDTLQHHYPTVPILILATDYHEEHVYHLREAGVKGYIITTADPAEAIVRAIRTVVLGGTWFSPRVTPHLFAAKTAGSLHAEPADPLAQLTQREIDVVALMTAGWTNQQMGSALGVAERTIRFHLRNVYDKLNFKTRGEAIAWAIKSGAGQHLPQRTSS